MEKPDSAFILGGHGASLSALPPHMLGEGSRRLWVHEIKHDGFPHRRAGINSVVRLQTKQG